jgi:hypothetical protein
VALSDDARHVGDRVLYCAQDNTFSAPHGERFDRLGRYMGGPAAGDLGRYPLKVKDNRVLVDVSGELELPDRSPSSDAPAGPRCEGAEDPPGFFQGERLEGLPRPLSGRTRSPDLLRYLPRRREDRHFLFGHRRSRSSGLAVRSDRSSAAMCRLRAGAAKQFGRS